MIVAGRRDTPVAVRLTDSPLHDIVVAARRLTGSGLALDASGAVAVCHGERALSAPISPRFAAGGTVMDPMEAETLLRKLDRRAQQVEQILPTLPTRTEMQEAIDAAVRPLATKEELETAVAKLATKEELTAQVASLATKAEMHEEAELTRRHFDVVAESLRDDIRLIAESHLALQHEVRESKAALQTEIRHGRKELDAILKNHDKRITRLESTETRRRKPR